MPSGRDFQMRVSDTLLRYEILGPSCIRAVPTRAVRTHDCISAAKQDMQLLGGMQSPARLDATTTKGRLSIAMVLSTFSKVLCAALM